jgi:hypothetical protein
MLQQNGKAAPNGVMAKPPRIAGTGFVVTADILQLSGVAVWNMALSETLTAQGFTAANGWVYNNPPKGYTSPVQLANDAVYNVTQYDLSVTPKKLGGTVSEPVAFSLSQGGTPQPKNTTLHWLNLLNESQPFATKETGFKPFGFQIQGFSGYWEVDNGDVSAKKKGDGIAPFYDSNNGPNIKPPNFSDNPSVGKAIPGTYLHFYTIPTWDVSQGGTDYLIVGDPGVSWGYAVTPEPSTLSLAGIAAVIVVWCRRKKGSAPAERAQAA